MREGYDINKWVEGDISERRHAWVRWSALAPFAALPLAMLLEENAYFGMIGGETLSMLLVLTGCVAAVTTVFSPFAHALWNWSPGSQRVALDEREQAIVARANVTAYRLLGAGLFLFILYAWAAVDGDWWLPRTSDELGLLFAILVFLVPTLQVVVAEWTVPLLPADGDD